MNFVDPTGLDPALGAIGSLLGEITTIGPGTSTVTINIGGGPDAILGGDAHSQFFYIYELASTPGGGPQNPITETTTVPLVNLKKLLQDTLAYGDCADFLARLVAKAGELSKGKNDPISTT